MGVMSCSRKDCPSIMCDTHVDGVGYVCYDCQKEFQEWLDKYGEFPETEREIAKSLKEFMAIHKNSGDNRDKISVDQFFRRYTR